LYVNTVLIKVTTEKMSFTTSTRSSWRTKHLSDDSSL